VRGLLAGRARDHPDGSPLALAFASTAYLLEVPDAADRAVVLLSGGGGGRLVGARLIGPKRTRPRSLRGRGLVGRSGSLLAQAPAVCEVTAGAGPFQRARRRPGRAGRPPRRPAR